jgi:hypothetical protein
LKERDGFDIFKPEALLHREEPENGVVAAVDIRRDHRDAPSGTSSGRAGWPRPELWTKAKMTSEITTSLPPEEVLRAAKAFFMGDDPFHTAWLESESESHLSLGTFRGNIAVAAFPDPEDSGRTRVRVSTLREEHVVPRLLTYLSTLHSDRLERVAGRA